MHNLGLRNDRLTNTNSLCLFLFHTRNTPRYKLVPIFWSGDGQDGSICGMCAAQSIESQLALLSPAFQIRTGCKPAQSRPSAAASAIDSLRRASTAPENGVKGPSAKR